MVLIGLKRKSYYYLYFAEKVTEKNLTPISDKNTQKIEIYTYFVKTVSCLIIKYKR